MNQLKGVITAIETDGHISLVTIEAAQTLFSSLVIDTPTSTTYLKMGKEIWMVFKETEMSIGKNISGGLSLRNRFRGVITAIDQGSILTKIRLDFKGHPLYSLITTQSVERLGLKVGDEVEGLVKTNEISLMENTL